VNATNATGIERAREVASRRFWLAATTSLVVLSVATGAILGLRNRYRATATVVVDPGPGAPEGLPAELEARLQIIGQQILSASSLMQMVNRFDLYPELRSRIPEQLLLQRFRSDVVVEPQGVQEPGGRGRTVAFTVSYRGGDRTKVAAVTSALAEAYVQQDARDRGAEAESLRGQVEHVRRQLDQQERKLAELRGRHGTSPQAEAGSAALGRATSELRASAEGRIRAMEKRSAPRQPEGADPGVSVDAEATAARMARLNEELAELRRSYTDRHPDVERVKAEIATLEAQSKTARRRPLPEPAPDASSVLAPVKEALHDAEQEVQQLRTEEATLRRRAEEHRQSLEASPTSSEALLEQTRDYETTKALYTGVLQRYEEARLAAVPATTAFPGRGFRMLEAVTPPAVPAAPSRIRLLLMALALALAAGVGACLLAEHLDVTFRSMDDLRSFTRVPVLVSIPEVRTRGERLGRFVRRTAATAAVIAVVGALSHVSYRVAHGDLSILGITGRVS
jgi:succinoglycan biosynthesis transport protein ExoP